ncbi:MAG TPA: ECF transporter S component [Nitrososphaerales archaeon]|nr:ECF transporter S component [Nitrososphaerales archaeon]
MSQKGGEGRRPKRVNARSVANTAVFTAFVAAVTMAFAVYIPATRGYFDIGEIMVYVVAMLMGPRVGAFAGGVGSAISDAILAPVYAPGTLVIKGVEGLIVGSLTRRNPSGLLRGGWRMSGILLGILLGLAVAWIGTTFLSGPKTIYLGFSYCSANCTSIANQVYTNVGPQFAADFYVPSLLWVILGAAAFLLVTVVSLRLDEKIGWTILAILIGGSEMVAGYFLYESIGLQLGYFTASVEVPINVGQVLVGLIVAIPVVRSIRRVTGGRRIIGEAPPAAS